MSWTAKQISDLDNSMVAAQNVSLGTVIAALAGASGSSLSIVSGSVTPTNARHPVATGLTTVTRAIACLSGSPTLNSMFVSCTNGSVAGTIDIYSWKPTNGSAVNPIEGTATFANVSWIAIGT